MIGFLQPLALLALVAAAGPALLHLLQRREPPVVPFPAVQYLHDAARQHSRRLRLRNLLLLVLRTLIVLLLVLAAARPVARVPAATGHAPLALAVVVDHSLSSGAVVDGMRTADTLAARARRIVAAAGPDDHLWLVLADGVPRRVSRPEAEDLLADVGPAARRMDLGAAVRAAARALAADPLPGQVVVLSDNQATAWSPGAATVPVLVWETGRPDFNRGIDRVRAEPPVWPGRGRVVLGIAGEGGDVAVRLEAGGRVLDRALAAPGEVVELAGELPPGWHAARVALDGDELRADDERFVALRVMPPARAVAGPGAGTFAEAAVTVLRETGRFAATGAGARVTIAERLGPGAHVLLPPADPALLGTVNRQLAARGVAWRFGVPAGPGMADSGRLDIAGTAVHRRYRLEGAGDVVASVDGAPWIVRAGDVVLIGSRLDPQWTELPAVAPFIPFLDALVNEVAAADAWTVEAAPGAVARLPVGDVVVAGPAGTIAVGADGSVTAPLTPGVWFTLRGGDTVGALTVNPDPRESRLAPAPARAVRAALGPDVRVTADASLGEVYAATAARADLTSLLLLLALGVIVAEFLVAARIGKPAEHA